MEQLSSIDASFLHVETPETPMHVGFLMLIDVPEERRKTYYEDFKAMVGQRLGLAPILTRKLALMPFELSEPVWIEDEHVDLDYHVRSMVLREPGTMRQLDELVARLQSMLLDRSRPLWEMYVIEGLESGQVALYTKAHHSGIDGRSSRQMTQVLYDTTPEVRKVKPRARPKPSHGYQLGVSELMQVAMKNAAEQYRKMGEIMPTAARAWSAAAAVVARHQRRSKGQRQLALGAAPRTLFNVSVTNQRSFAHLSLPFQEIKEIGKRAGGTINTVVMTMCSIALSRYLKARDAMPQQPLIAGVPVSLGDPNDDTMNNQVSAVRVDLATDIDDLAERFKAIHASSEVAKAVVRELRPVMRVNLPTYGAPWIMTSMASLYGRSNLPSRLPPMANVGISNVPGPQEQLYICGGAMRTYYAVSIPYHGAALNITLQSYAGKWLDFGIISCRRAMSQDEVYELSGYLQDALEEIKKLPPAAAPEKAGAGGKGRKKAG